MLGGTFTNMLSRNSHPRIVTFYLFGWTIPEPPRIIYEADADVRDERTTTLAAAVYCFQYLSLINFVSSCNFHYIYISSELRKTIFYGRKHGKCICHPHLTAEKQSKSGYIGHWTCVVKWRDKIKLCV